MLSLFRLFAITSAIHESQTEAVDLLGEAVCITEHLIVDALFKLLEQGSHRSEISPRREMAEKAVAFDAVETPRDPRWFGGVF